VLNFGPSFLLHFGFNPNCIINTTGLHRSVKSKFGFFPNSLRARMYTQVGREKGGEMFRIKEMRERSGLSQKDVAAHLGVKVPRYGDWERETTQINLRDAIRLADLFQCSLDELAGRTWESDQLSTEEQEVVDAYRSTDQRGKTAIMRTARGESGVEGESAHRVSKTA
jgi:transcriptional regulator with XRE-family HTH domain